MTNKLGVVVNYGCFGGKGVVIHRSPNSGSPTIQLPACFDNIPVGFIAYLDDSGKIAFMDEDPNEEMNYE